MNKGIGLFLIFISSVLNINIIWADPSLNEIRYALFKDPNAKVMDDLQVLANFGDRQSMLLLGNQLIQRNSIKALELYKKSYAEGQGEIAALTAIARLLDTSKQLRKHNTNYIKTALTQYPLTRDQQTLLATLEVFVTYPELINNAQVEKLIALYQSSCLEFCRPEFYNAVLAEKKQDTQTALSLYEKAFFTDSRSVIRYYKLLGEQQDKRFPLYVQTIQPKMNRLPVTTVHNIASLLDIIYSTQHRLALIEGRQVNEQNKKLIGTPVYNQLKTQLEEQRRKLDNLYNNQQNEINLWLDNAIARNWLPAMVTKVNKMTSAPSRYTPEETLALVDKVAAKDPQNAEALTVSVLMVSSWNTLNPPKAYLLIQELQKQQYPSANILLALIYSRGVLDEPDQYKALEILHKEMQKGIPSAFYTAANLYYHGRAICRDKSKAYAYLRIAHDMGEFRATGLLKEIAKDMTTAEQQQGLIFYQQLAKEYQQ